MGRTVRPVGKPDAGNQHVRFDERGRETERAPWSTATAPVLDSTKTMCPADVTLSVASNGGDQCTTLSEGNRMTKIPSIEKTDDYIYRATRSKGAPIEDPEKPAKPAARLKRV